MSGKAVGFADLRSRRRFMSHDRARANARHHCRRSAIRDRTRSHQRRYDGRVSPLRSMPDRGKDAAVARSQMRATTTISSAPVSTAGLPGTPGSRPTSGSRGGARRRWHLPRLSIVIPSNGWITLVWLRSHGGPRLSPRLSSIAPLRDGYRWKTHGFSFRAYASTLHVQSGSLTYVPSMIAAQGESLV